MAGEMVTFSSNGGQCQGYLAKPDAGGPGVVVLQEWWGLVDQIKGVADRLAEAGFVALAPDLYHGQSTRSPDAAGKLMMALNIEAAARDLAGSADYLLSLDETRGPRVGSVGFCMGGQLSLYAACHNPGIGACVVYYGIHPKVQPDIPALEAPVLGFFGEKDASVPPQAVRELEAALRDAGKSVEFHIYPQRDHAFFNEVRPDVYHQADAEDTWTRMIQFFRQHLSDSR